MVTQNKINALRKLLLGPLFDKCKEDPFGVKKEELEAHLDTLKKEGCIGDCTVDEFVKMCQLKSHFPSCMKDGERGCVEEWFGKQTGINKVYYNNYKGAKMFEDEPDDDEEDEEDKSCAICGVEPGDEKEEKDMLRSCGHYVHKECLIKAADSKYRDYVECPVCRKKFSRSEVPMPEIPREERMKLSLRRSVRDFLANGGTIQGYARNNSQTLFSLFKELDMTNSELKSLLNISDKELEELTSGKVEIYYSGSNRNQLKERYNLIGGKKNGIYEEWYPAGQMKIKATYKDDKLHGVFKSWYNTGLLFKEVMYDNGKLNGKSKKWSEDGELIEEITYRDGVEVQGGCSIQ